MKLLSIIIVTFAALAVGYLSSAGHLLRNSSLLMWLE